MKKIILLLLFVPFFSFSQERSIFFGKIIDELGELENAHVLNITTNQATSSNFEGKFKIFAKEKDSLKITSVGYRTEILILKSSDFGIHEKQIYLKKEIVELDEIELKKHTLLGILNNDLKQTPEDIAIAKSNGALDFSKIDFSKKVILPDDEAEDARYPDMQKVTDPTQKLQGITLLSKSIFTSKKSKRLKQRLKREKERDQLPKRIVNIIGKGIFIQEFKIPKDKIYHFLEYCGYEQLNNLSSNEKVFDLIEFLSTKSKSYLEIINKNK